jgi:leader peptidase (prepilin peptidase)/N-methyltransferase
MLAPLLLALLGWLAGALGNLAADRLPPPQDPAEARPPFHLVHVVTLPWFLARRGVCPGCGAPRPLAAPLLELACIAVFVAAWFRFGPDPVALALFCLYTAFLLTIAAIDVERRLVLNVMLAPAAVVALALSLLPGAPGPLGALLGGAVGLGLFLLVAGLGALIFRRNALGAGDVKLAGVIGLMTGFPDVFTALFLGVIFGGVGALALILLKRAGRRTYIAYAPYLCLGAIVALWRIL